MSAWTEAQRLAVEAEGGSILVSAAAGSGKTSVLVGRILRKITDPENPVDVDTLLVTTYTKAAAAELRARVREALSGALSENPGDRRLRRQRALLSRAPIGTIHAFCFKLLQEHCAELGVSPAARILDENERDVLRRSVAEETVAELYAEDHSGAIESLSRLLSIGADDRDFIAMVLSMHDFFTGHPFPARWQREAADNYRGEAAESIFADILFRRAKDRADYAADCFREAEALCRDPKMAAAYGPALRTGRELAGQVAAAAAGRQWDRCHALLRGEGLPPFRALRTDDAAGKAAVTALRNEGRDALAAIRDRMFLKPLAQFQGDLDYCGGKAEALFKVVDRFAGRYDAEKRERALLDFSDLEQLALRLLWREGEKGFEITPLAKALSERYSEILVDEYQDANEAQDMIFTALSRGGENLFMVGDVKQSIYEFRQARPQLFVDKKARFEAASGAFPKAIDLAHNFRSKPAVTDFVNRVCGELFHPSIGGLSYGEAEALVPAGQFADSRGEAQVYAVTAEGELSAAMAEAEFIAGKIAELCREAVVECREGETLSLRRVKPSDIAVLTRTRGGVAPVLARVLESRGVDTDSGQTGDLFDTREVAPVLCLLECIDNPQRDLSVVGAMLSPLFQFTPDDIAAIRLSYPRGRFILAAERAAAESERAKRFVSAVAEYRADAAAMSASALIRKILFRHNVLELTAAMPHGASRVQNLQQFLALASARERGGEDSLPEFLRFVAMLRERPGRRAEAAAVPGDAVHIMTVHKSKGLEFPICFVAGLGGRFHADRARAIASPDYGFACLRVDEERNLQHATVPFEALQLEAQRAAIAEELRILYVAMTRAKERLYLTAQVGKNAVFRGAPAPRPEAIAGAASPAQWLSMILSEREVIRVVPGARAEEARTEGQTASPRADSARPAEERIPAAPSAPSADEISETAFSAPAAPDPARVREIRRRIAFRYPHAALSALPAKVTVTELIHPASAALRDPDFATGGAAMSGTSRGTAAHLFLQHCDFAAASRDPRAELDRLAEIGVMSAAQRDAVSAEAVGALLSGDLGRRMLAADEVLREYPFLCELPAGDLGGLFEAAPDDEKVLLQGVIDCVAIERDGLLLVDYKTDRVSRADDLALRYGDQLRLYALAAARIFRLPEERIDCAIYSLHLRRAIGIPRSPRGAKAAPVTAP